MDYNITLITLNPQTLEIIKYHTISVTTDDNNSLCRLVISYF